MIAAKRIAGSQVVFSKSAVSVMFITASFLMGYGRQFDCILIEYFHLHPLGLYMAPRVILTAILFNFALYGGSRIIRQRDTISGTVSCCFMISATWAILGSLLQIGGCLLMGWMFIDSLIK